MFRESYWGFSGDDIVADTDGSRYSFGEHVCVFFHDIDIAFTACEGPYPPRISMTESKVRMNEIVTYPPVLKWSPLPPEYLS